MKRLLNIYDVFHQFSPLFEHVTGLQALLQFNIYFNQGEILLFALCLLHSKISMNKHLFTMLLPVIAVLRCCIERVFHWQMIFLVNGIIYYQR